MSKPPVATPLKDKFHTDADRLEDLRRRTLLNIYRKRLGLTLEELAAEMTRLQGEPMSYWTLRAWLAGHDSTRGRPVPNWPLRLLVLAHPKLRNDEPASAQTKT